MYYNRPRLVVVVVLDLWMAQLAERVSFGTKTACYASDKLYMHVGTIPGSLTVVRARCQNVAANTFHQQIQVMTHDRCWLDLQTWSMEVAMAVNQLDVWGRGL